MLKKTIAMALVVSAVSGSLVSVSAYAAPMDRNNTEVNHVELSNAPKITGTELKDAYGTVEYRISYDISNEESKKYMNDYLKDMKEIIINDKKILGKDFMGKHYYGIGIDPEMMTKEENEVIIKSKGCKDVLLKIKKTGELISEKSLETKVEKEDAANPEVKPSENNNNSNALEKEINLTINDKLEDGEYTLGFKAYKENNKTETSMLQGAFDKNVKLTVKNGKYKLSLLNIALSEYLYDFTIGINNKYTKNIMTPYGELDKDGIPTKKLFEIEIDNLKPHKAGVLVSAMGGQASDIGNFDKYTKLDFVFNNEVKKGWKGFLNNKTKVDDEKVLNDALIDNHLDLDKNGIVTDEELSKATGEIDLSGKKITDISRLANLGSGVTKLYLNGNNIKELPKGIFDKLTNLERLNLCANRLVTLPKGLLKNLKNMTEFSASTNNIKELPEGIFDGLTKLKSIGITNNEIESLPENIFKDTNSLNGLYLYENKIKKLPKSIGNLKKLEGLYLAKNSIESVPSELKELKLLRSLDLSGNYIKEIPSEVYDSLKNLERVNLNDNELTEIPENIIESHPKLTGLEIALNKINKLPNISKEWDKNNALYKNPQKVFSNLKVTAKDNVITWNDDLSILDLLAWFRLPDREKTPNNVEEYKKFLNGKKVEDVLDKRSFDWTIKTELQKKDKNGKYITLMVTSIEEKPDKNGTYEDKNMKNGDEYRIVKTLYTSNGGIIKDFAFRNTANAIALKKEEAKKDLEKDTNLNVKPNNEDNKVDPKETNSKEVNNKEEKSNNTEEINKKNVENHKVKSEENKAKNAKEEKLDNNEVTNDVESKESKNNASIEDSNNELPKTGFEGIGLSLGAGLAAIGGMFLRKKRK
ncbi:NEAT domain-containing protein [Eubacterium multiforme]|uniref:LPXTG-motif cell wall-anchored protein n=1 Tax=Eubacterium multiforme TaxID=83339 RepID=A0ABT9UXC0_9FIRM|nr:NEAT domain-containing protein [Eubacterium multiforme]MDQ0150958.1 LPXTG-motif cell wall-anchored protein [Eubacterium multiforme]